MSETKFSVDYAKRSSKCKKCKQELPKGLVRIAKIVPNFFHDGDGEMKQYHHIKCLFETFLRAKSTTKIIESADEVEHLNDLNETDKQELLDLIEEIAEKRNKSKTPVSKKSDSKATTSKRAAGEAEKKPKKAKKEESDDEIEEIDDEEEENSGNDDENELKKSTIEDSEDNKFETFVNLCNKLSKESGSLMKTAILKDFLEKGSDKKSYKGDLKLLVKFLLPNSQPRVYNLNSVSLAKLFSRIFNQDQDEMVKHLNNGDVAVTIRTFFEKSTKVKPLKKSILTLKQVDDYLDKLTQVTKENDQIKVLQEIAKNCTLDDILMFIRLVKKDLRINAGEKPILDAVASKAYEAFKVSRDLDDVLNRACEVKSNASKPGLKKDLSIRINIMKPVKPMLAEACKSIEQAVSKNPNGFMVEIKYDGERLQIHKNGYNFHYFSRNLKQVQPHKVQHLKEYIPKAFPNANDLILDGEVLLYDTKTKKPLPFGTLGVHKKNQFKDALVCYYVFDCIYYNGEDLMNKTVSERRKILEQNIKEIPGRIMLSEIQVIKKVQPLRDLMMKVIKEGLEGLILKEVNTKYEPGKRHWLKMKKDYLDEGSMADTADLVCLGAYYGTGIKGGLMSIFLMGVYNAKNKKWQTVTKVGNGFTDSQINELQKTLDVVELNKNPAKVPEWLDVHRSIVPDLVVNDPKKAPVWEITGAEFSNSDVHTADGISIRFPRVTRVRDDKSWKEATDLERLKTLFKISKEKTDLYLSTIKEEIEEDAAKEKEEEEDDDEDEEYDLKDKKTSSKKRSVNSKEKSDNDSSRKAKTKKVEEHKASASALPSVFKSKKFYIHDDVENVDKLKRYIIAYDGEIVDEDSIDATTYVVQPKKQEEKIDLKKIKASEIKAEDLWQSIKKKTPLK